MTENDFAQFRKGVAGVYAFYEKDLSDFSLDLWWRAMKRYDLSAIIEGFNRHVINPEQGKWLPKPADIIKMLDGGTQDSALLAWAKVDRAVREVGTYQSVFFDDPLIHKVLSDMGGWIPLGMKTEEEWPFVAKEFENRYRGYKSRNEKPEYRSHLIGLAEAHNSKEGHKIDKPVIIGNHEQALLVYRGGVGQVEFGVEVGLQKLKSDVNSAVGSLSFVKDEDAA